MTGAGAEVDDLAVLQAEGEGALKEGRPERAVELFQRATRLAPDQLWRWLWLARALDKAGEAAASLEACRRALALRADFAPAHWQAYEVHSSAGRQEDARRHLEIVVEHPSDAIVLRKVANLAHRSQDQRLLTAAAEGLRQVAQDDFQSVAWRAVAHVSANASAEAAEVPEELFAGAPDHGRRARALFLALLGQGEQAWQFVEPLPGPGNEELLYRVGRALRQQGQLSLAQVALSRAAAAKPTHGVTRLLALVSEELEVLTGAWSGGQPVVPHSEPAQGRILHVLHKSGPFDKAGYSVRTASVVKAQQAVGFDPEVVTRAGFPTHRGGAEGESADVFEGVLHHRLPLTNASAGLATRLDAAVSGVAQLVRSRRPALLHAASDYRNALVAMTVAKAAGIPFVYEVRGFWEETRVAAEGAASAGTDRHRLTRAMETACMQQADAVVTLAHVMKQELVSRGVDADRITVIPNAVDVEHFRTPETALDLRRALGIPREGVVVGYVSSFSEYEGIEYLIRAVARLDRVGRQVTCLLVGDGPHRQALEAEARAAGVRDRVVFTGRVPHEEVLAYYGLIDVFVVPRTKHRVSQLVTPLKPYEAMAAARAVVVSDVPALKEMVVDGTTGLTFPAEDDAALAYVLTALLDAADLRRRLGMQAQQWVREHRTWRANGTAYQSLYESLGVRGRTSGCP